jgi:hypothetical protein
MKTVECEEDGCTDGAIRKCSACGKKLCNLHLNSTVYELDGEVIECDKCFALREQLEDA